MLLLPIAYLGGVLTILSPCILPVLPFVFARAGQPFLRSSLPLLLGMAASFAAVATLAAVGGGWAVQANEYGRYTAIALLGLFGLVLAFPGLADRLAQPLVAAGSKLSQRVGSEPSPAGSLLLGLATGLLWAPCAGPILGLLLTSAALQGASARTALLLLAYGLGAATSLAAALLVGGKVFAALKRSLGLGEWLRRGLGFAILAGVVAIALGLDTGLLTRLSLARTAGLEQSFVDHLRAPAAQAEAMTMKPANVQPDSGAMMMAAASPATDQLPVEGSLPSLAGATTWLNSPQLTPENLRGKVVLIDFWTYSCINCLRTLPYLRAWADKYRDQGLVVIGVHSPEFAFEKDVGNVRRALADLKISYPVAVDDDYAIWRAFDNQYWPAHYFIDAQGRIRYHHYGEGEYQKSEQVIRELLREAGHAPAGEDYVQAATSGVGQGPDKADEASPETYVGYSRAENFASPGGEAEDRARGYAPPAAPRLNQWGLGGRWTAHEEKAVLDAAPGRIVYRFHARDLHLVLGPAAGGKPVRFRVSVDGLPPGESHGVDTDAQGLGTVTSQRLYQLVRQAGAVQDRTFEIEFLDAGVEAYSFTFG
jgi:cytochrome c biogenesis protein CcdA/thiol-disulfide isomerase/thioredoxin